MKDDPNKTAPGGLDRAQKQQNDNNAADFTAGDSEWKGFSGHFDTRSPSGRVKRRAIELSQWEFGDGLDWEAFVEQAKGDVR